MMAHKESGHVRIFGVEISGLMKRIFVGPERAKKTVLPGKISPIRPGRGMPIPCDMQYVTGTVKQRFAGPAIWSQFGVDVQDVARVFVVGSHSFPRRIKSLAHDLSLRGLGVDFCDDFEETLRSIAVSPQRWNLLIVDIDHVEIALDSETIFKELAIFREQFSNIAVVLLSHSFTIDDPDPIMSAIADHCFRTSVVAEAIYTALPQIFTIPGVTDIPNFDVLTSDA